MLTLLGPAFFGSLKPRGGGADLPPPSKNAFPPVELEPHINLRLMSNMRIYNFQIPRTTLTNGLMTFSGGLWGSYEIMKFKQIGPTFPGKTVIFGGRWKVLYPAQSKWGKVTKNLHVCTHTHTCIRKYAMVGANLLHSGAKLNWGELPCWVKNSFKIEFTWFTWYHKELLSNGTQHALVN